MLSYQVTDQGQVIGTLTAEREGLYWHLSARCRQAGNRLLRLYALGEAQPVCLGVLMPEGEDLVLNRRLAARSLIFTAQTRISTGRTDAWEPWAGTVLGEPVSNALRRGDTVAIPCKAGEPFPLMTRFRAFSLAPLEGELYWMLHLGENL